MFEVPWYRACNRAAIANHGPMTLPETRNPTVVLLHGLALWPGFMRPMAGRLAARGWRTLPVGYRSRHQTFAASVAEVRAALPDGPIHLVGHSLGGLIAAALLRDPQGAEIGRVVQIGSPNLGSPQAVRAGWIAPIRWFYGPVLGELHPHEDAPEPDDRIGAVAGTIWPNLAGGQGDGAVRLESALAAAGRHATVRVMHTLLPLSGAVAGHVGDFLAEGRFAGDTT